MADLSGGSLKALAVWGLIGGIATLAIPGISHAQETDANKPGVSAKTHDDGNSKNGTNSDQKEDPLLFSADEVDYSEDLKTVTARGNVEISRDNQVLMADTVSYDMTKDIVSASGNVKMLQPNGEVIFANYIELTGDFKEGIVKDIYVLLDDHTRLAGVGARRSAGNFTELAKAVYSPCNVCKDNPDEPPLWRIKAARVIHDQKGQSIEYKDARLEFEGIPVLYSPYFSHPDPTVKRRSGFLAPSFGSTSYVGPRFELPYYWAIDKSSDLTVTPIITAKKGAILSSDYRRKFDTGNLNIVDSLTDGGDDGWQGHIDATGRFDIDKNWRWGFDAEQASSKTYMSRYGFGSPSVLTSNLFTEHFTAQNYGRIDGYYFQGLKEEDSRATSPLVLPHAQYHARTSPDANGAYTTLDLDALSLSRRTGADSNRLSGKVGWEMPHISDYGDVTKLTLSLRGDSYLVNNVTRSGQSDYTGYAGRTVPLVAIDWNMPFVRDEGGYHQVIKPIAMVAWSPNGGNPDEIPNEDSQSFEFDDINLFSHDRYGGLDKIEDGLRASYGLEWGVYGQNGGYTNALFGQSYRLEDNNTFAKGSGLDKHLSDYVGRLTVAPNQYVDLTYRFRLDSNDFSARRNQVSASVGDEKIVRLDLSYLQLSENAGTEEFNDREEFYFNARRRFDEHWSGNGYGRFDMDRNSSPLEYGIGFQYEDECFIFDGRVRRTFYQDQDLGQSDEIMFRLVFKTLGEFASQAGL
ncbi:LPS-assembly protein LptD [Thalassospira profundimaris]|uniref:LPS-assembly protein LptD n=1 Tax=Thalassospira profundimaris TaxID=502049 RepID=UPI000DEDC32E|nr:LPS assembly protein LptD [Thalassospira profundimaris]